MKGSSPLALVLNVVVCTFWFERERDQLRLGLESNLRVSFQDSSYMVRRVRERQNFSIGGLLCLDLENSAKCLCVCVLCMYEEAN